MNGEYEHLFVREMTDAEDELTNEGQAAGTPLPPFISASLALMRAADVPGAPVFLDHAWIGETTEPGLWVHEHVHDYDEVLIWVGNDPRDRKNLGGELYLDIEGERYTATTSGSVLIPAGVRHCPLGFTHVERPFHFMALALNGTYTKTVSEER